MKLVTKRSCDDWKKVAESGEKRPWRYACARIAVLASLLALAACVDVGPHPTQLGYRHALDRTIGAKGEAVVRILGVPTREHTSPDGSKSYEYMRERTYTVRGGTEPERVLIKGEYVWIDIPQPDRVEHAWCRTTFYISPFDTVTGASFDGPDCRAFEKKAN
jgi:hypothetical protein